MEQRKEAAEVVRQLGHVAVAMEDYTSTEQKPVDKCREDVKNSDILIGIYGYRYGHSPRGYKKSITHLEYEAAGEVGIPRLIFVIGDDCPWPNSKYDKDLTRINAFRADLLENHTATIISNIGDLSVRISTALSNTTNELEAQKTGSPRPNIPTFLPYLSNRSKQEEELEEIIANCYDCLHQKPLVCFIHGDEQECHCSFIEKMQKYVLPEMLHLPAEKDSIERLCVRWPGADASVKIRLERLQRRLAWELTGSHKHDNDTLIQALNSRPVPVILDFSLAAANWQDNDPELITRWLEFWNELSDLAYGKKIFLFLCIKYKNTDKISYCPARKYKKRNEKARDFLKKLDLHQYKKLNSLVFTELAAIEAEDLDEWVDKYAANFCDAEKLRYEIGQYYKMQRITALCMVLLAERLHQLCCKTQLCG